MFKSWPVLGSEFPYSRKEIETENRFCVFYDPMSRRIIRRGFPLRPIPQSPVCDRFFFRRYSVFKEP